MNPSEKPDRPTQYRDRLAQIALVRMGFSPFSDLGRLRHKSTLCHRHVSLM
jgi:hypothetical protein